MRRNIKQPKRPRKSIKRIAVKPVNSVNSVPAVPALVRRCKNCGQVLYGEFCSHCGQEHYESKIPAKELVHEFFQDEFKLDRRILRTLLVLLFRPGFLTAEFIAGRRVRYVPPLRTYVFISVVLFSLTVIGIKTESFKKHPLIRIEENKIELTTTAGDSSQNRQSEPEQEKKLSLGLKFGSEQPAKISETPAEDPSREAIMESLAASIETGLKDSLRTRKRSGFEAKLLRGGVKALEDPEKFTEMFLEHLSQAMFILMPLFALLLKLLYLRRKRPYIEHLIFALHVHAFAFFIMILSTGARITGWQWLGVAGMIILCIIPAYLFIAMYKFYCQRWAKTLAKFLLLGGSYLVLLFLMVLTVLLASIVWL